MLIFFTVDIEQPLLLLSLTARLCLLLVVHQVSTWFSCSFLLKLINFANAQPAIDLYYFCREGT